MLRWAILGTSFISETMARAIAGSPGSTAVVVAGRDPQRLEDFRSRHAIPLGLTSLEDAVSHPEVDAVYVGLPNHVHHEAVALAAAAGKAVLSEKSLTVSMAQSRELVGSVEGRVFFVEGLMYLAHPFAARLLEVVADGRLGRLKTVVASYSADIWQLVNPAGRGAVYNLGCYPVSLVQLVVDRLEGEGTFAAHRMSAYGTVSTHDGNVSEASAVVQFEGGSTALVHTAESYGMAARFEVHGDRGTLAVRTNPWLPSPGTNSLVWTPFDGEPEVIEVHDPLDAFDHQVRMVEAQVRAGVLEAPRPSPRLRDSLDVMAFLTGWEHAVLAGVTRSRG